MSSNKFDWRYYINRYEDLKILGVKDKKSAIEHYKKYGKNENRFPNRIIEAKNDNLNNIDNKNSFLENISEQLNTNENSSSLNSVSEINTDSNSYNTKIYNEILYLKNDISSIKQELNKITNLLSKKYTLVKKNKPTSKKEFNKLNLSNKSIDKSTEDNNKIISSEEYEVCDNLSDESDVEINTVNYSNEIESNNSVKINSNDTNNNSNETNNNSNEINNNSNDVNNNSNDVNIDEISYDK